MSTYYKCMYYKIGKPYNLVNPKTAIMNIKIQDMRTIKIMRKNVKKIIAMQTCTKNKGIRPTIHF